MDKLAALLRNYEDRIMFLEMTLCDPNQQNVLGDGPLHCAAIQGELEAASTLIDAGANLNLKGECGRTPVYLAVMMGQPQMVAFLLSKGANADEVDDEGTSARALASEDDDPAIRRLFSV